MRTNFNEKQLADPQIRASEAILRNCVHCGFCNATCPTFQLTGDELDGPRGRIYLMQDMLESGGSPADKVVKHLDRCLSCLSCMTTCPSGVDYMHLVDHGRSYIEQNFQRNWLVRCTRKALAAILPNPGRFRRLLKLLRLFKPPAWLLPAALLAPFSGLAALKISDNKPALTNFYPTAGKRQGAVALLAGCVQSVIGEDINLATIRMLNRLGFDVQLLTETACCGAIEHHLGQSELAINRARSNLHHWSASLSQLSAVISNASGCGTMLKDYGHLLQGDSDLAETAKELSRKTMDICEFLDTLKLSPRVVNGKYIKVAYQSPCSMQHGQKVIKQPPALLRQLGFTVSEIPEAHLCCGSAGTYSILQAKMAKDLALRKIQQIKSTGANVVASGNLGCMMHLQAYTAMPFVHTIELLDWASGGPLPAAMSKLVENT